MLCPLHRSRLELQLQPRVLRARDQSSAHTEEINVSDQGGIWREGCCTSKLGHVAECHPSDPGVVRWHLSLDQEALESSSRPKAEHTQAAMPCSSGTRPVFQDILANPMVYGNQGQKTITCLKAGLATSWLHVLGQPLLSLGLDFVICKGDKDALAALEDWGPVLHCPSPQLPQHPLPFSPGSKPVDLH